MLGEFYNVSKLEQKIAIACSNVGVGWHNIVKDLTFKLHRLDPHFTLIQVKEKFGSLRYSATTEHSRLEIVFKAEISTATELAKSTCEKCGDSGVHRGNLPWEKVLCDACYGNVLTKLRNHALSSMDRRKYKPIIEDKNG